MNVGGSGILAKSRSMYPQNLSFAFARSFIIDYFGYVWLYTQLSKFFFTFWCWLWKSTITSEQIELIKLQSSEDLKSNFLLCCILDFYKNHTLLFGWFLNLITHIQQVVCLFDTTNCCEQLLSKMKLATVKSLLVWHAPSVNLFIKT